MATELNFSKAVLQSIEPPKKPEGKTGGVFDTYHDSKQKGLVLVVSNGGAKTFYFRMKFQGKSERVKIGSFPEVSIENARKKAITIKAKFYDGKNPNEEKRRINSEITFGDFFKEYMERHAKVNKRSWIYDEREVNKYLSHWFKRKLSSISKYEVQKLHQDIARNNGHTQANRILERARGIYNKAIDWGWEGENPASGIRKFKEKSRDRFIQPNEMPFLFQALQIEENYTARDFIYMALMTGARKSNVLAMRWQDISFERNVWRIPETKNGEPLSVPLIPQAVDLLNERRLKTNSEWVFQHENSNSHLADPKKAWDRIRHRATLEIWRQDKKLAQMIDEVETRIKSADNYGYTISKLFKSVLAEAEAQQIVLPIGLQDLRLHDIRRTMGSYQAITGASLHVIGKSLGHKSPQPTMVYAHLYDDPIRDSMHKAAQAMWGLAEKKND